MTNQEKIEELNAEIEDTNEEARRKIFEVKKLLKLDPNDEYTQSLT